MRKGRAYQELLSGYINNIGREEIPGGRAELEALIAPSWLDRARVTDHIVQREGKWEVHLILSDRQYPMRFVKNKLRPCRSRKLAEIIGRYSARCASCNGQCGKNCIDFNLN